MRGLAILSIVFHNYIHQGRFGFAMQNESSFDIARTMDFLAGLGHGVGNTLCEIGSFLGWLGVPVFVFLSGYGLVKKYESPSSPDLAPLPYIKHSWMKLFKLMLPGILFFAIYLELRGLGGLSTQARYVLYLSLLGNLFGIDSMSPSIYWYFGLTFELYLVYLFFNKYRSNRILACGLILPLLIQGVCLFFGFDSILHYNLRNVLGWMSVFCFGMLSGRSVFLIERIQRWPIAILFIVFVLSGSLMSLCNFASWSWLTIHYPALFFFLSLMLIIDRIPVLSYAFAGIGAFSSLVFVCHPIARALVNDYDPGVSLSLELLCYVLVTIILVFIFSLIRNKVPILGK